VTSYFDDDSMVRRVHRESVVALSGPRTLLMQAAHPVAFAGFFAHTGALDEPYERLARTAQVMDLIAWGTREEADRATRRVRAMHKRVRGTLAEPAGRFPAGTPYAADDPALLLWVLACLVDSALVVFQKYVRRLTPAERVAAILWWSALPGTSRHHWGTDFDVLDAAAMPAGYKLQVIPAEYLEGGPFHRLTTWLDAHMGAFGFFRPYTTDRGGVAPRGVREIDDRPGP
jgi:hypothetical protein